MIRGRQPLAYPMKGYVCHSRVLAAQTVDAAFVTTLFFAHVWLCMCVTFVIDHSKWEGVYVLYTYAAHPSTSTAVQKMLSTPEAGGESNILRHMTFRV